MFSKFSLEAFQYNYNLITDGRQLVILLQLKLEYKQRQVARKMDI